MRLLLATLEFFLRSSLFIGLCAVAFVITGYWIVGGAGATLPEPAALIAVGSATFSIYNLNLFLVELLKNRKERTTGGGWLQQHRALLLPLLCLALGGLFYALWTLPVGVLFFLGHLGVVSVLYSIPDRIAQSRFQSLRSIPLVKIFLIAYVWAAIGSFLPYMLLEGSAPLQAQQLFIAQFVFILAITLPFDVRDHPGDQQLNLLTIPGLIGQRATCWLAVVLMVVYVLLMALWFSTTVLAMAILAAISIPLLAAASPRRPYWYYLGLVDGLILVQLALLAVAGR